ncbi:MAG: nucleotide pyrophosphohydrolase [Filomicrobium sp.]
MLDTNNLSPELKSLLNRIVEFRDARDWAQFHSLKNLAPALSVEASELVEITQWKSEDELERAIEDEKFRSARASEVADVLIYLLLICVRTGLDPKSSAHIKIQLNEERYPAEKVRGSAAKYTELE